MRAELGEMPEEQLNILLVIARPYGKRDIALRTIARPMLAALAPIRAQVNLKVLRPPSFDQFQSELNARKGFYHIVHFDGHGSFDAAQQDSQYTYGGDGQGVLVFEKKEGSPQPISAADIAQHLADCRVPIFILNACQSGQAGRDPFSSVATRLVSLGAKGVVAMAYSVYAEAAKHFIGRLYEQLVLDESLSSAVAAGRRKLSIELNRPSPKGWLPLQDWLVPVLYQQESYTPFPKRQAATSLADIMGQFGGVPAEKEAAEKATVEVPDAGAYGFVGRDYDIQRLERAFRQNPIVLMKGMGGVGKTELAIGFARWLHNTGGRIGGIFFTSFEQGATLNNVVNQIGRTLMGDRFAQFPFEQQRAGILQYLQTNPCLLIWDNFEPVAGFPTGNEPLLPEEARDDLKHWLKALQQGKSWVLITSRRAEPWLDCGYTLLGLSGLSLPNRKYPGLSESEELADKILQSVGVNPSTLPPEYLELLNLLGGHPLSLRVVLPHLKTQHPTTLIDALRQGLDTFRGAEEEGRAKSLTVSLDYSFTNLSDRARQHLPCLAFFSERVNAYWLHAFSENPDDTYGQAYQAMFGENLQKSDWLGLLDEAAEAGILEHLGETYYNIHPALPWYLRQQLSAHHPDDKIRDLEKKWVLFYAGLADNYRQKLIDEAELATNILLIEESNLLTTLRLAEQQQDWDSAFRILAALGEIYERLGRRPEFRALRQRTLGQIGLDLAEAKAKGREAFDFWIYLRGADANEAMAIPDLETARAIYREILDELTALSDPAVESTIAVAYHNLGIVAEKQRQFDQAVAYYQKSLEILEAAGNDYNAASDYHQLGNVAEAQRQFDQAVAYYQKALEIYEAAGDDYNAADEYQGLGDVAKEQGNLDAAATYYQQAVEASIAGNGWRKASSNLSQMGRVLESQENWQEATETYIRALGIDLDKNDELAISDIQDLGRMLKQLGTTQFETIWQEVTESACEGDIREAIWAMRDAEEAYQSGMAAQEQQQYAEVVTHYQTAFDLFEQFGLWQRASATLIAWGKALEAQENWQEALKIYIQALAIDLEENEDWLGADLQDLGRMLKVLGESQFKSLWRESTENECPEELYKAIQSASQANPA
ncbi:MAG: tetratricopeptide repeat protein [Leptolyngbyaceae cyanobacterium MO_188.B28]|nr:tetratricopeptide repeat protein [Leptolyngbyaceae cyanobacterium MO_188.B28]